MKPNIENQVRQHGENLIAIFGLRPDTDPVRLCKELRRKEGRGSRSATDYCNGDLTMAQYGKAAKALRTEVIAFLVKNGADGNSTAIREIYINGDPRGYCLKLNSEYTATLSTPIHRDWGGYGILAPEFN